MHRRTLFQRLLILLCFLAMASPAVAADTTETKAKTAELKELRARLNTLRDDFKQARGRADSAQEQLRRCEQEIGRATRELRQIDQAIAAGQKHQNELLEQEQTHEAAIAEQRDALARQVRSAYLLGQQEPVKLLLNQEDPARLDRTLAYYGYLNRARLTQIAAVEQQLLALKTVQDQLRQENARLQELRAGQLVEQEALRQTRAERSKLLAAAQAEVREKGAHLAQLEQDERNLQNLLRDLQQAMAEFPEAGFSQQPFTSLKGRLPLPVQGRLAARYGAARGNGLPPWRGLLIRATAGSPVRAVARGRVAFADWLRGFGLIVILDHGGGYMSLYGYNQGLYKETGEWVAAGDVIAAVGDSGGQAQNGVYFEIRHGGQPVDPLAWCGAAAATKQARRP